MEIRGAIALLAAVFSCKRQTSGSFTALNYMITRRWRKSWRVLADVVVVVDGK